MKLTFYFDVYPGMDPNGSLSATTKPYEKMAYSKRYKLECEIPDPNQPDATVQGTATEVKTT